MHRHARRHLPPSPLAFDDVCQLYEGPLEEAMSLKPLPEVIPKPTDQYYSFQYITNMIFFLSLSPPSLSLSLPHSLTTVQRRKYDLITMKMEK